MSDVINRPTIRQLSDVLWEIPQSYRHDMRVPARVFASEKMLADIERDRSLWQLVNLTTLPGIVGAAYAMPDVHEGYGSPVGGVFATRADDGIISPGACGYDVNCGVRLLASHVAAEELRPHLSSLANQLMRDVPSGVGRGGAFVLKGSDMDRLLNEGVRSLIADGYATEEDLTHIESQGSLDWADASKVSAHAKARACDQVGTLGSGNHFLEVQRVETVFEPEAASRMGLVEGNVCVMIHTGSRGLGHQTCTDYVRGCLRKMPDYGIMLPDRELACVPFHSKEGQDYFAAMAACANFAWGNRQVLTHLVRQAWRRVLERELGAGKMELRLVYDVAHNIVKRERHVLRTEEQKNRRTEEHVDLIVHRKGATRAFGPGNKELTDDYRDIGQPVLIPGSMGTASYVLVGTEKAMALTFGSSCHGAGRMMSRHEAKRRVQGAALRRELEGEGIMVRCAKNSELAEEAPLAYKDVDEVVDVVHDAGIARKVARLRPMAVIKG
jgi:tRNA-splicing ligase RtcB